MTLQSASRMSFAIGALPLLGLTFFSPGLQPERALGFVIFGFGLMTLVLLIMSPHRRWGDKILIALQLVFLALVVYETLSGARLYLGT
jgi:succinate-acetate transporter protein